MEGSQEEDEAALSDFEDDDLEEAAPVVVPSAAVAPSPPAAVAAPTAAPPVTAAPTDNSAADSLKTVLAELEQERQGRKAAEAAKVDAETAAVRLKSLIHEVIRQRDEALRHKDEAVRGKEERSKQLEESLQLKEDVVRQRDEIVAQRDDALRQRDDITRARDAARAEIEGVARILVTQAERLMSMSNGIKSFSGGLPRVPRSTGLAAIALGFSKRVEEVVEEALRQREDAVQQRNELHSLMEQRNFSIAIEVSQLEASITQLKEEVSRRSLEVERWQKLAAGKDGKIADLELATLNQLAKTDQEAEVMKRRVEEIERRLQTLNYETGENLECAASAKAHLEEILGLMIPASSTGTIGAEEIGVSTDEREPQLSEFLAAGKEIIHLAGRVALLWEENQQRADRERKDFESTVRLLHAEKGDILQKLSFPDSRSASPRDSERVSKDEREDGSDGELSSEVSSSAEDGKLANGESLSLEPDSTLVDSAERYQIIGEGPQQASLKLLQSELAAHIKMKEEMNVKVSFLEQEVERLQQQLKKLSSEAKLEIERLQKRVSEQTREFDQRKSFVSELERHIDALARDLVASEEEVLRWRDAATQEAAAGAQLMELVESRNREITDLTEQAARLKELIEETNSKIASKENMAMAAIAALNAAERSRQIADERVTESRHRIEELNGQLEELEQKGEHRRCGLVDLCWPWFRGRSRSGQDGQGQLSAEMEELLEPLV